MLDEDERVKTPGRTGQGDRGRTRAWVSGMLRVLTLPAEAPARKLGTPKQSVSYDSMIRIRPA